MNRNISTLQSLMKRLIFSALMGLLLARPMAGQTLNTYTNNGQLFVPPNNPPQVDATNFLNNGLFYIDLVNYDLQVGGGTIGVNSLYDFSNVQNFTNRNRMFCNPGFRFDTEPSLVGERHRANSFVNATLVSPAFSNCSVVTLDQLIIDATNVVNRGLLQTANIGLLQVHGGNVDLSRGGMMVDGFGNITNVAAAANLSGTDLYGIDFITKGVYDGTISLYWAVSNGLTAAQGGGRILPANFPPPATASLATPVLSSPFIGTNSIHYYNVFSNGFPADSPLNWTVVSRSAPGLFTAPYTNFHAVFSIQTNTGLTATQWINTVFTATATNRSVQVVYVHNPNTNITVQVASALTLAPTVNPGVVNVAWTAVGVNGLNQTVTNGLLLHDTFGNSRGTDGGIVPFTDASGGTPFQPTYRPDAYHVFRLSGSATLTDSPTTPPRVPYTLSTIFAGTNPAPVTNMTIAAYGVQLTTTNVFPRYTVGQSYNTLPGRTEIVADNALDLTLARIDSLNYLSVFSTNHFIGSSNAIISVPFCDIALGSTNGSLTLPRMLTTNVLRLNGNIDVCSIVWTNFLFISGQDPVTVVTSAASTEKTNATPVIFNVVMVDSHLNTTLPPPQVLTLWLRSTNTTGANLPGSVTVGDTFNVASNLFIDASGLTMLTNGQFNFSMSSLTWADQVPFMQSLTNGGIINNAGVGAISSLGGDGLYFISHDRATGNEQPYANFVNQRTGRILSTGGVIISANYIQNDGIIAATNGPIFITGSNVFFGTNLTLATVTGDINISANSFGVTNNTIIAAHALTLSITNTLVTGPTNAWSVSDGFNLLVKPATGDFRSTIVTNTALNYADNISTWAGLDLGPTAAGYTNNGALGRLILDGGLNSQFTFIGTGYGTSVSNALYLDRLDLTNSAANTDAATNFTSIFIAPGMKIYYTNAFAGTTNIGALLNGRYGVTGTNGGSFVRVSHLGLFSASSGGGGLGAISLLGGGAGVALNVTVAGGAAHIAWNTANAAGNTLYYSDSPTSSSWQPLTNFISGADGRVSVDDAVSSTGRYYKVQIDLP